MPKPPRKLDAQGLWDYALRALGRRALSTGELRAKLTGRAESPDLVEPLIARLAGHGYLDDARFADSYSRARLENEGFGRQRVLRDLRVRRVGSQTAEAAVDKAFESVDEASQIEAFLRRKFRGVDLREELKQPTKLASAYRKLRYAGFSAGKSMDALRRYSDRADELVDDEESV
jgi:regulatory protein